ncbi:DNA polymerase-3 subunit epsilon [Murinocardiopsis flavida]|uniref:DNA polymerase-3 subunit epsilon n=1 Tax=Murinocardiopsis flavida TaxID=645275 RepID=A0A2P8C678_9ACTN|nr:exonuclease domain-containing protein [Murinocardiopsis flavida]PSK80455.1 DNA polymerase-3 subunit epsilon [Murinocardiopsis flavida]
MSWHEEPMVAFDTETTGTDLDTDRIVSAALLRIDPAARTVDATTWLIDPGIDIPAEATAIHGITTDHAREHGRPAADAVGEIAAALAEAINTGLPIVVYNAPFDLTLVNREVRRHKQSLIITGPHRLRVIDPLVIDKHGDRYRKGSRKLADVCAHHGVHLAPGQAHGAHADALAAARLAWKLAHTNQGLAAMGIDELHANQERWKADQAASFQAHLRATKDPDAVIDPSWPVVIPAGPPVKEDM